MLGSPEKLVTLQDNQQPSIMIENLNKYIGLKKGVLTIVKILTPTVNNKHTVVECVCSKCGSHISTRLDRMLIQRPYAEKYCKKCRNNYYLEKSKEKYIGVRNGVLECLDIVKNPESDKTSRTMAICKCHRCGAITTVRVERLSATGIYTPQSCDKCINDLQRIRTTERYNRVYGCSGAEYKQKHHDAERIYKIQCGAKERNIAYLLTDEQAIKLLHGDCYYCGQPHADGIDRYDSNQGYTLSNCVPCCKVCNIMKNKFDSKTFFKHIKLIYERHCNEGSTTISEESTL